MSERDDARRMLRELLPEVLGEVLPANGNGHVAPAVPAPPVAAVLRPSTWDRPPVPGEVIGDGTTTARPSPSAAEPVALASDEDLDRFVRALAARCEDPQARAAIRSGAVRFTLGRGAGPAGSAAPAAGAAATGALRLERGAVTERTVAKAAAAGTRIVLGPGAVLTPLAREKARALGVEIERERRC